MRTLRVRITTRSARGNQSGLLLKWVRAKVSISPQIVTSRFESAEWRGGDAAALGRKACRFATKSLGTGAPKRADLSLFHI